MTNEHQVGDEDARKRRVRLAVIVVAHVLIVLTFFISSFFWNRFT